MVIQIVLLILVLASFVVAYFAARTWHWSHVLVMLGIFLATVGFFVLTAEVLRINAVLRRNYNETLAQVVEMEAKNTALEKGTKDPQLITKLRNEEVIIPEDAEELPSLAELEHQLNLMTRTRGRVWPGVAPVNFDPQSAQLRIGVQAPTPAGFTSDSLVFVFEQGPPSLPDPTRGRQYLGEFRITESAGQEATLEPVLPLDEFERQRLAGSRGPWVVYETMPADRHEIFAGMTEQQLRSLIPERSVGEYLRHGKEAGPDDEELDRAGLDENGRRIALEDADKVIYERRLRDYALEFEQLARQRAVMLSDMAGVRQDNERLAAADESAKKLQAFRQAELRRLNIDLAGIQKERQAIGQHLAQVQRQVTRARELLAQTLRHNRELAKELANQQSGAIDGAASPIQRTGPLALGTAN